jgi:hypothetical protein
VGLEREAEKAAFPPHSAESLWLSVGADYIPEAAPPSSEAKPFRTVRGGAAFEFC